MADFIIIAILILIIGAAVAYIVKVKKAGNKCIGCPVEGACPHMVNGTCSCSVKDKNTHCHTDKE
ncbi:MAG: FeoB-associated Cys-rich membrane protein [Lachnospiraceae bacterium]|nr:FeoB-associated Cys-rich membrane protein [Lachnospiraceae bacterium]